MPDLERTVPQPPADPDLLRVARLFTRASSTRLLSGFLEDRGWHLLDACVVQALYRPGRACTLRFRVHARPPTGAARHLSLCLRVRARWVEPVAPTVDFEERFGIADPMEVRDGVLIWAFPYDPVLSGLPDAMHGPTVRDALDIARPASIAVDLQRYRPGQRAAIRYMVVGQEGMHETVWGKVISEADRIRVHDAYRSFRRVARLVPPRSLQIAGAVAFPTIEGSCLRDIVEGGGPLPDPARIVDLIDRLADTPWLGEIDDEADAARAARSSGRLLAFLLPSRREEVREIYRALAARLAEPIPRMAAHGDLYEGQLFVDDRFRLGLIDLEDAGLGDPMLDAANMLAHLRVLHAYEPEAGGRPIAYRHLLRTAMQARWGASDADLDWREAVCLLHLATGPFRVQSPGWREEIARRLDEIVSLLTRRSAKAA